MILTDKCEEDFNTWYLKEFEERNLPYIQGFNISDLSIQYGVYVDFFDSVGIELSISKALNWHIDIYYPKTDYFYIGNDSIKTRQEARQKAIEKANEIYNKL